MEWPIITRPKIEAIIVNIDCNGLYFLSVCEIAIIKPKNKETGTIDNSTARLKGYKPVMNSNNMVNLKLSFKASKKYFLFSLVLLMLNKVTEATVRSHSKVSLS